MKLPFAQIDAFADRAFAGNPAAVIPLETWLDDAVLQAIAAENNLSETAFYLPDATGEADFELRWFTPRPRSRCAAMRRWRAGTMCWLPIRRANRCAFARAARACSA